MTESGFVDGCGLAEGLRFPIQGEGMATQGEKYTEGKFANPPHPKDGYPLPECKVPKARKMLEFIVSIRYREKLARVMVTVENTIFMAYTREREVDWALVMRDMVKRLLTGIGKSKPTPIYAYLLHLYIAHDVVQLKDKKVYMVGESFMRHDIKPKEDEPAGSEDSEPKSLSLKEVRELQKQQSKKQASPPKHKVTSTSGRKDKEPQVEERPEAAKKKGPFSVIADALNEIREHFVHIQKINRAACVMVGAKD